jgi:hypothetical protein
MSQPKDPSNEILWELLQNHPYFSDFKRNSPTDWRDPAKDHFSIGPKGFYDHKTGESGSLAKLAKREGLNDLLEQARKQEGQKSSSHQVNADSQYDPAKNKEKAAQLWKQAESEISKKKVITYLTEHRKIPLDNFEDLLGMYLRSVADWDGNPVLLIPMIDPEQAQFSAAGSRFNVEKIQRIILKGDDKEKKQLGGGDQVGRLTYFPPLSANAESLQYLVCEGLEDALSIRSNYQDHHFLLTHGKGNLKYVPEFLPKGAEISIISDHDAHENPKQNGETAAAELNSLLRKKGYLTSALMPKIPKEDANSALQKGKLEEWFKSLIAVPPIPVQPPSDFDIELIKSDLPVLPRGILPTELESYLELAAESLDLNYEAAFCEFLVNASVAIGGNKQIVIRSDWQEKACIWLASIGKSGSGKTPLHRKCGGQWLEGQQKRWKLAFDEEVKEWKKNSRNKEQDEEPPEKPTRKRLIVSGLTLERLFALHEENSAGIGIVSDEIIGLLNGLNQYKSRGNDRQKLISFWNGHPTEYPTADSDRYVQNPHIPICGGIQDDLVRKFINEESHSDGLAARFLYNHLIRSPIPASIERQEAISDLIAQSRGKQILERVFEGLISIRDNEHQVLMSVHAKNLLALLDHQLKEEDRKFSDAEMAAYNKLRTYIFRVALLLHYVFEQKPDETELSEETAQKAIIVMRFFIACMKRAYGSVELSRKEVIARKILSKVKDLGGRASVRDVKQPLRKSAKSDEFDDILKILVETGELIQIQEGKTFQISLP